MIPVIHVGQVLRLKREPDNCKDKYAVAIVLEDCVVGHVPYNLAKCVSQFLSRDANKGFARVTGSKVNRGAGYGLRKMKTLMAKLRIDVFL